MSARGGAALYTPAILARAVELADYPMTADLPLTGEAHSRVCGSRIAIGMALDAQGRIAATGAQVTACAIGQAAAALFLKGAHGSSAPQIGDMLLGIEAWLAGDEPMPDWPGLALLEPARAYPARHPAIVLPWKAALAALSKWAPAP